MPAPPRQETEAKPPTAAPLSASLLKARAEWETYRRGREAVERRSVLRGLVLIAILVLAVSLFRAGTDRAFYAGWWRQW